MVFLEITFANICHFFRIHHKYTMDCSASLASILMVWWSWVLVSGMDCCHEWPTCMMIPLVLYSVCSARLKKSTYALVAEYTVNRGTGLTPEAEATLMITPFCLSVIPGSTRRVIYNRVTVSSQAVPPNPQVTRGEKSMAPAFVTLFIPITHNQHANIWHQWWADFFR